MDKETKKQLNKKDPLDKQIIKAEKEGELKVGLTAIKEKPLKVPHTQKVALDMQDLMLNPGSHIHCDKCHERIGVLRTLRHALFKKQGTAYFVPCPYCQNMNKRVKGQFKEETNKRWKDFETGK